jgi:hypothetical protein
VRGAKCRSGYRCTTNQTVLRMAEFAPAETTVTSPATQFPANPVPTSSNKVGVLAESFHAEWM